MKKAIVCGIGLGLIAIGGVYVLVTRTGFKETMSYRMDRLEDKVSTLADAVKSKIKK